MSMNRLVALAAAAVVGLIAVGPAGAHHSTAAFDTTQRREDRRHDHAVPLDQPARVVQGRRHREATSPTASGRSR